MGVVREYGLRRSQILNIFSEFNQKMFFFFLSFFRSFSFFSFFFSTFLYDYSKVNTFGTKVQIEDTVFPPLLESGRLFLRVSPSRAKDKPFYRAKAAGPLFLSYFKTLSINPFPGTEHATSRYAVQSSNDSATPAAVSSLWKMTSTRL